MNSAAIVGGGFVSGSIIGPQSARGVTRARTDIGGVYRWNAADKRRPVSEWLCAIMCLAAANAAGITDTVMPTDTRAQPSGFIFHPSSFILATRGA